MQFICIVHLRNLRHRLYIFWLRCMPSFSLLRSAIMCIRGSRPSYHRPTNMSIEAIDLSCSESRISNSTLKSYPSFTFNICLSHYHVSICSNVLYVNLYTFMLILLYIGIRCYKYISRERYTRLISSLARFRPLITRKVTKMINKTHDVKRA